MKKPPVERTPRLCCDACAGRGANWSEKSLAAWKEQTPWFDRERMSPPPPQNWLDENCTICKGTGFLNLKTKEPLWELLVPSARPRSATATGRGPRRRGR